MDRVFILLLLGCGAVIGLVCFFALKALIEKRAQSLIMARYGEKGREKRKDNEDRMLEAVTRAMALHKEGHAPKEIAMTVLSEYPDVAARLTGKILKGKIPQELKDLLGMNN